MVERISFKVKTLIRVKMNKRNVYLLINCRMTMKNYRKLWALNLSNFFMISLVKLIVQSNRITSK